MLDGECYVEDLVIGLFSTPELALNKAAQLMDENEIEGGEVVKDDDVWLINGDDDWVKTFYVVIEKLIEN